jgi:hypothetical protein
VAAIAADRAMAGGSGSAFVETGTQGLAAIDDRSGCAQNHSSFADGIDEKSGRADIRAGGAVRPPPSQVKPKAR